MSYAPEDEVDWSDGSLRDASPEHWENDVDLPRFNPVRVDDDDDDDAYASLFYSDGIDDFPALEQYRTLNGILPDYTAPNEHPIPNGSPPEYPVPEQYCMPNDSHPYDPAIEEYHALNQIPLDPALLEVDSLQKAPSHDQRAKSDDCLHQRIPSKEDYANFSLYQANQKVYEATLLKQFVEHALHPNQIDRCFGGKDDFHVKIDTYMALVASNVSQIANNMVWNAHHRVINMLANDGRDSAPFLDVQSLNLGRLTDFGPGLTSQAVQKVNESWHHAVLKPVMVQLSTSGYPVAHHSHPLEDVDDANNTLFNMDAYDDTLAAGCTTKVSRRKERRKDTPGTAFREKQPAKPRGNWLTLPAVEQPLSPCKISGPNESMPISAPLVSFEDMHRIFDIQNQQPPNYSQVSPKDDMANPCGTNVTPTQLEMLFERHGANVLRSDFAGWKVESDHNMIATRTPSWSTRLLDDHRRRLAERCGAPSQAPRPSPHSFRLALGKALAMGLRPTEPDWREKANIIERRERQRDASKISWNHDKCIAIASMYPTGNESSHSDHPLHAITRSVLNRPIVSTEPRHGPLRKKRKKNASASKAVSVKSPCRTQKSGKRRPVASVTCHPAPLPPHPSGSTTLEQDQTLPPQAYFEPQSPDEKPAWRCSIKHAMGHYYNAGDRKACRGCNTSLMDIPKVKHMDFYLPRKSLFFQPAAGIYWKPNKPLGKERKSNRPCHNSIAKDAFWAAVDAGATPDQARQAGCHAVVNFLRPKPRKEPIPEPTTEPEPDLGPHPSGSRTMEHGQDLPDCAYATKQDRHEELAWRCDVSHALGRYYLAGDRKSCPGCGTNKGGLGRQTVMDYYMPPGVILRQEAPGLVKWKPRKNKSRASGSSSAAKSTKSKAKISTHNQICAEKYFEAKAEGYGDADALRRAVQQTDAYLDGKEEESARKYAQDDDDRDGGEDENEDVYVATSSIEIAPTSSKSSASHSTHNAASKNRSTSTTLAATDMPHMGAYRHNSRGGCTVSLVPMKRGTADESEDDLDSLFEDEHGHGRAGQDGAQPFPASAEGIFCGEDESADGEESEGSDSE